MSHEATNWAIAQRCGLPAQAKLVLWHLADRYHPDYGCFPNQSTLAAECEISRASLNVQIGILEKAGLIRREQRMDPATKRRLSTRYRFSFEAGFRAPAGGAAPAETPCATGKSHVQNLDMARPEPCPESGQSHVQLNGHGYKAEPVSEPVREREGAGASAGERTPEGDAGAAAGMPDVPTLAAFRDRYPRAAFEPQGRLVEAWGALPETAQRAAIDGVEGYCAAAKAGGRRFLPKGAEYLEQRLWTSAEARAGAALAADKGKPPPPAGYWQAAAWSRDWWALLFAKIEARKPVALMLDWAGQGKASGCPAAEQPGADAIAALSPYPSRGEVVAAWRPWFEARGVRLRQFSGDFWVFLPSSHPPGEVPAVPSAEENRQ